MSTTTTTLPGRLTAGDTLKFTTAAPEYPASSGWQVELTVVSALQRYTATSTASGADHQILVDAATTNGWVPGNYTARLRAKRGDEVYTIAEAQLVVAPSFSAATDARSQARRQLDAIEAAIEGRATDDVMSYQIAGRELRRHPLPDLLKLRDRLRSEVAREEAADRIARGLQPRGRISVRFGP